MASALFQAIENTDAKAVAAALSAGADPNEFDPTLEWNALHQAALEPGRAAIVKCLLDAGGDARVEIRGYTPLLLAAEYADLATVEALVASGVEIDGRQGNKGLGGQTAVMQAAEGGHLDILKFLVDRGASLDITDSWHRHALHIATRNDHRDIIEYLLDRGVDVDIVDKSRRTPLYYTNDPVTAQLLLARGADRDVKDHKGLTLLAYAKQESPDIVNVLEDHTAAKQPVAKPPAPKQQPVTKGVATKTPATKKPATKPATKKPATKKPATKKPATKPAMKKPATKKPAKHKRR